MTTSQDGGLTWGPTLETADHATGLGGQPLVQPSGRVVVPYVSTSASMRAFISDDGGESWSSVVTIADVQEQFIPGGLRHFDLPSARIDGDGKIYVVWDDCRFRPSCRANDIAISTSTDGLTWSAPNLIPIHDTEGPTSHFIPGLAVDRTTSGANVHLALAYYYYPNGNCTEATCQLIGGFTWSWDGGSSWGPAVDVTNPMMIGWLPDTASGRMVGDYIAAYFGSDGNAHPIFASASPPNEKLFFEATHTTCGVCPPPGAGQVAGGSCCNF
jgi:hypothetical protein